MKTITYTLDEIAAVAGEIMGSTTSRCLAFYAPMGAGKTTLIKALVAALGSKDEVSSPTFGLVNEYHNTAGEILAYHFDFYRLTDEIEALDMGIDEYLDSDIHVFIEWPEKIPNLIPTDVVAVHIEILNPGTRKISF